MGDPTPVVGLFGVPWLSLASVFGGGTFGLGLAALIKVWPDLNKQGIDDRALRRKEDHEQLDDCRSRLDAMDVRLTASETRTHSVELRLVSALSAVTILATELQRLTPRSSVLRQAQRLLVAAYPIEDDMPSFIADILKPIEDVE